MAGPPDLKDPSRLITVVDYTDARQPGRSEDGRPVHGSDASVMAHELEHAEERSQGIVEDRDAAEARAIEAENYQRARDAKQKRVK
ncbi:MAG: hypothetical protein KA226_13795 [Gemmatimonadales bacterium]|nr:hypothetical protein [Gemmatimonadales bacterium]